MTRGQLFADEILIGYLYIYCLKTVLVYLSSFSYAVKSLFLPVGHGRYSCERIQVLLILDELFLPGKNTLMVDTPLYQPSWNVVDTLFPLLIKIGTFGSVDFTWN